MLVLDFGACPCASSYCAAVIADALLPTPGWPGTPHDDAADGNVGASGRKHGLALNVLRGVARANFVRLMAWLMPLRTWKQIQHRWPSDTCVLEEAVTAGCVDSECQWEADVFFMLCRVARGYALDITCFHFYGFRVVTVTCFSMICWERRGRGE